MIPVDPAVIVSKISNLALPVIRMTPPTASPGESFVILTDQDVQRLIHRPFFEEPLPPILPPDVQTQLTGHLLAKVFAGKLMPEAAARHIHTFHGRCRTLAFMRYGEKPSAIILIPEALSYMLPPATRQFDRSAKPLSVGNEASYKPTKRKPRSIKPDATVAAEDQELAIEAVDARKVMLKLSPTRITEWGIELRLLGLRNISTGSDFYTSWFNAHKLELVTRTPFVNEILRGALRLACVSRELIKRVKTMPRFPLIHNQRGGNRFLLYFDQERMGSPADIHVLIYTSPNCPQLHGWSPLEKPTANEHKHALLLAATADNRVRFYQPTEPQWTEWQPEWDKVWPEFCSFLTSDDRSIIENGVAAAKEQRRISLSPPPAPDGQVS